MLAWFEILLNFILLKLQTCSASLIRVSPRSHAQYNFNGTEFCAPSVQISVSARTKSQIRSWRHFCLCPRKLLRECGGRRKRARLRRRFVGAVLTPENNKKSIQLPSRGEVAAAAASRSLKIVVLLYIYYLHKMVFLLFSLSAQAIHTTCLHNQELFWYLI